MTMTMALARQLLLLKRSRCAGRITFPRSEEMLNAPTSLEAHKRRLSSYTPYMAVAQGQSRSSAFPGTISSLRFFSSAQPSNASNSQEDPAYPVDKAGKSTAQQQQPDRQRRPWDSGRTTVVAMATLEHAKEQQQNPSIAAGEQQIKQRRLSEVPISEVIQAKHSYRWVEPVVQRSSTIEQAIVTTIEGGLSGMMVLDAENQNRVAGLLTSRDLLRILASGIRQGEPAADIMKKTVGEFMTPISQVIFARPEETVGMCRTIMAKLGIKCLPILSREGRVEGLITARDMSDYGLSAKDKGGKKSYLDDVSERMGLSSNTSMAEPPPYLKAHLALEQTPLYINVDVAELPHPFKTHDGMCGTSQKEIKQSELSTDPSLSEDAYFIARVTLPDEKDHKLLREFTYMGVADGVGSWREYGVDPRHFSHRLMEECENILQEASASARFDEKLVLEGTKFRQVIAPAEVLEQAYQRVKAENVIGSTTACVALFDSIRHQLHFSNLGDSGIIVLRHIDSDVAGTLKRDRKLPRDQRKSDLRVAFVSQQQLRSFNHPYQIGWTGEEIREGESSSFKQAREACTSSIHLRRGDIVIMATDGLFDNVDEDEICNIALEWEEHNGFLRGRDVIARERRWKMGNSLTILSAERVSQLAEALCVKARENSLNNSIDSPFAILAKENDIMWSGGMPDDCTVMAIHVVGRDPRDAMDKLGF